MKNIIYIIILLTINTLAQVQTWVDTSKDRSEKFRIIGNNNPLPVQILFNTVEPNVIDTVVTATTTPKRLDSLMSRADMTIKGIYLQNNTAGATLYIGNTYGAKEIGMVCFYGEIFGDGIGYFRKLSNIILVGTTTTEVRIKLVY